jgi:transcriptional regulator with XRE-family HTH domain
MAMSTNPALAAVLREWEFESGKRRETVCVEAEVSYPYLSRLLREGGNPSAALLFRLAEAYGRDVNELLGSVA